jgi:hypothetical protein
LYTQALKSLGFFTAHEGVVFLPQKTLHTTGLTFWTKCVIITHKLNKQERK